MKAAVEEANAVGKYVLAHAYSGAAIRNAVTAGVRCIEHGNLLDAAGAQAIKKAGSFLVPTMVTYEAIYREGKNYGIGDHQIQKINIARERSVEGLTQAYRAGCKIGSGSDLLGDMQSQRTVEFELKGQVMKPMEVLVSATQVNAQIFKMEQDIGTVEAGKYADLLLVKGNPLKDLRLFQNQDNLLMIMKGGVAYKRTAWARAPRAASEAKRRPPRRRRPRPLPPRPPPPRRLTSRSSGCSISAAPTIWGPRRPGTACSSTTPRISSPTRSAWA
jgi:imidazolonepropionase-like amidohydrolase